MSAPVRTAPKAILKISFILKPARLSDETKSIKAGILLLEPNRESRRNLMASCLVLDGANDIPDKFKIFSSHGNLLVSVYIS
jgi:hypothetical protein